MENKDKQYCPDTDIMRILCSFLVVLLHTVTYSSGIGRMDEKTAHIINVLCRGSLPVFIMVSGRYMLDKDRTFSQVIRKSVRTLCIMLAASLVYLCFGCVFCGFRPQGIAQIAEYLLTEPVHLWYMYTAVCLYIFTPFIRVFIKNASERCIRAAIAVCLFLGSAVYIPLSYGDFYILEKIAAKCHMDFQTAFIGCYMLGFYMYRYRVSRICGYIIYAAGTAASAAALLPESDMLISFFAPNVLAQSAALFLGVKELCARIRINGAAARTLHRLSGCTMFVYLFHPLVLRLAVPHTTRMLGGAAAVLLALAVSAVCAVCPACLSAIRGNADMRTSDD